MNRVVDVQVRCSKCNIPSFGPLDDNAEYMMAITSFMANGGDGYYMFRNNRTSIQITGYLDTDVVIAYIKKMSPLNIGLEGRILFVNQSSLSTPHNTASPFGFSNSASTLQIFSHLWIVGTCTIVIAAVNWYQ